MFRYIQYLNCKILHGGTLLQYFSEDYVIPSPKLTEDQKKMSFPKIEVFSFEISLPPQFESIFGRNLLDLFMLAGSFSSDHPALKWRWGDT